jgi:hypothetical protein
MPYQMTAAEREKHKRMMADPGDWPRWPILPLKRTSPQGVGLECAIMVAWEEHLTTVFFADMFDLPGGTFKEVFGSLPQKKYTDYDAILDDGWMVD